MQSQGLMVRRRSRLSLRFSYSSYRWRTI